MALHGRGTVSRAAQLHRLRCVFDASSPEDLSLPSQNLGKACAHSFLSRSPVDFRYHDICSDCFPLLHAAQIRAGTLVARSTSLRQNEFDCHASSSRGSFRQSITMFSTLTSPHNTCRHRPRTHNASCPRRLGPDLSTCCLAAASVFGRTTSL